MLITHLTAAACAAAAICLGRSEYEKKALSAEETTIYSSKVSKKRTFIFLSDLHENTRIFIIMLILGLLSWTGLAKLIRGQILAEREKEFVTAARSMGVNTTALRLVVILCATLLTSASVAVSGMIGWVGLVIPHFCRMLFGYDYRRLIPAGALFGASFLLIVDDIARLVTTGELPLGILTAFVGAPLFVYLIVTGGGRRVH